MNELSLEIRENKPGVLTTNAQEILDRVKEMLPRYKAENYSEDNLDEAKADKAMLNKLRKALNDERIRLEREYMAPFSVVKNVISETCDEIGKGVAAIDEVVKTVDLKAKAERQKMIDSAWESLHWNTMPLASIQRPEWMNKDVSKKSIVTQMKTITCEIDSNIALLKSISHPDDFAAVHLRYVQTLNAREATQFCMSLKAIRAESESRKTAAEQAASEAPAPNPPASEVTPGVSVELPVLTRIIKIEGTRDQIKALGNFMKENGIKFWKVEM